MLLDASADALCLPVALALCAQRHSVQELHRGSAASGGNNRHGRGVASAAAVNRESEQCAFRPELNRRSLAIAEQRRLLRGGSGGGSLLDSVQTSLAQQKVQGRHANAGHFLIGAPPCVLPQGLH